MYTATYGAWPLYDPRDPDTALYDIELKSSMVEADELTFSMPPTHPLAGSLAVMGRADEVSLMDGDDDVFRGRVRSKSTDFYGCESYECEGLRAYLNDATCAPHTTVPPEDGFDGEVVGATVPELFRWYMDQYNRRVPVAQRIYEGEVQGYEVYGGDVSVTETGRVKVWDGIKSNIVDPYGAYVRVKRRSDGRMYVDLLASGTIATAQRVEFGVNLLDYTGDTDGTSFCTRIVPVGKTVEVSHEEPVLDEDGNQETDSDGNPKTEKVVDVEAGNPVYVSGELDASLPYGCYKAGDAVVNGDAELTMGVIEECREYDTADPQELIELARRDLMASCVGDTLEIKAIDLHLADADVPAIRVGQYVRATSAPHGVDAWFVCRERTLHPDDPERDTYVLGVERDTLTGAQSARLAELNGTLGSGIEDARSIAEKASRDVVEVDALAKDAAEKAQGAAEAAKRAEDAAQAADEALKQASAEMEAARKSAEEAVAAAKKTGQMAVVGTRVEYAASADPSQAPTDGWSEEPPTRTPGTYVWQRVTVEHGDGLSETSKPVLVTGNDGNGVESQVVEYAAGDSDEEPPDGPWAATPPARARGQCPWPRTATRRPPRSRSASPRRSPAPARSPSP